MARKGVATAVAFVSVGLASAAAGQEAQLAAQPAGAKRWTVTASATTTFDSNVRGQVLTAPGSRVDGEDVIFAPGVTAAISIPSGRQRWFANAGASYAFYQNNEELNRDRVNLDAGVQSRIGRCDVTPRLGFARGQTDLIDVAFDEVGNVDTRTNVALDVDCARPSGISPFLSLSRSEIENSGARRSFADSTTESASAGLSYSRGALGVLTGFATYANTAFPNRVFVSPGEQIEDGFEVWTTGARLRREVSQRLRGSLSASYSRVEPKAPGEEGFSGVTYGADLSYRPTQLTTVTLNASRDVQPSAREGATYLVANSATLAASYALGQRITLRAGLGHDRRAYEGAAVVPTGTPVFVFPREEEITRVFAGARWQFARRVALTADVGYDRRETDMSGFDYDSARVSLGAVATF